MTITICHNPACGTSRAVLEMIQAKGLRPRVIEYLKTPLSNAELKQLLKKMKAKPRDILRAKGELYEELNIIDPKWTDEELIDFMAKNPVLMNRPIVVTDKAARLCRPAETVMELLGE